MRKIPVFLWLIICIIRVSRGFNIDAVISTANIYYQSPLIYGEPNELSLENVNELQTKQDIKVIIHGFLATRTHISIKPLKNAYMAKGVDNVFLADWQDAAGLDYHSSRHAVENVAVFFAKMLQNFLNKHEIERSEVHIIGHSLGAHIAGTIGQYFNGTLGRVTGLDPALPLFTQDNPDSLHADAAQFVDVIHTDYPIFGDLTPRGTVDFYPNFGHTPQRGCDDFDLLAANSCSHNRAVLLYAESVASPKNFPALPCNLNGIKMRSITACSQQLIELNLNRSTVAAAISVMDESQIAYMGEAVAISAKGSYYLETYDTPPYGMGLYTQF